jgi:hypothetical protein
MLIERQATCKFCGKQKFLNVAPEVTEHEANELATQTCDCPHAVSARGMKITDEAINALLGNESTSKGFDYEVDEDTVRQVRDICRAILRGFMDKVSLVEPNGDTIKLVRNGNAVKIQRTCKKQVAI